MIISEPCTINVL